MKAPRVLIGGLIFCALAPASEKAADIKAFRDARAVVENGAVVLTAYKAQRYAAAGHAGLYKTIRIFRRECPDFVFGLDDEEYFSGMDHQTAELIYQGEIAPDLGFKFTFADKTVRTGGVYAYWLATTPGRPVGPVPVKVRDPEVWWTSGKISSLLEDLKKRFPDEVEIETIGAGTGRRPILGVRVGHGKKAIGLIGAVHAGESGPELIIPVLENLLERRRELLDEVSIVAIPSVNIDMRDRLAGGVPWYLRRNANLVDLNRNFPADWETVDLAYGYRTSDPDGLTYRGPFAGSEAETAAVMEFMKKHGPLAVFSFHCLAGICGEALLSSKAAAEDQDYVNLCRRFAESYWRGTGTGMADQKRIAFDCSSGSFPAWCYRVLKVPGFDMEAPFNPRDLEQCRYDQTDVALLDKYRELHFRGFAALLESLK